MTGDRAAPKGMVSDASTHEIAPGVPIEFADSHAASLTWERDAVHMPTALAPLAGDYALVLGNSLNDQYPLPQVGSPERWHAAVWHGYVYYAFERVASGDEWKPIEAKMDELRRERALVTESYWIDELLPELRAIYARLDAIDAERLPGAELAEAWGSAWRDAERAWQIHMDVTPSVYRTRSELGDLYLLAIQGASRAEVSRLLQGSESELVEMERATEALAALAASTPAIREALRSGDRSLDRLGALEGGPSFVAAVNAALATHGHLGQLADDLETPSFGEEPERYLTEIAKRLDGPGIPGAEERRRRLRAEADEAVERVRTALAEQPETLARFDDVLALARRIGPLSEGHNYWIDRAALAHLRRLVMRVAARLARDKVIDHPADIFYLRRAEVPDLLREPRSRQDVVQRRRAEHEADRGLSPASRLGGAGTSPDDHPRFTAPDATPGDDGIKGMGASAGIARGPARIVLDVDGFGRVQPGDIIVCRSSNPSFVPIFSIAAGLITNVGGLLSHAAVVAREFGLPAVVGVADATTRIVDGQDVEIDGTTGAIQVF